MNYRQISEMEKASNLYWTIITLCFQRSEDFDITRYRIGHKNSPRQLFRENLEFCKRKSSAACSGN